MRLLLALFIVVGAALFADVKTTTKTIISTVPDYTKCVTVGQPNRDSYSFYNGCGERLYINACIKDTFGKGKLYQSGRSIQVGGRYTIYADPLKRAASMSWVADVNPPAVLPEGCTATAKKY